MYQFIQKKLDWVLYLLEGKLECNLAGKSEEENRKLLAKGYKIKFSQINDEWDFKNNHKCGLHATMRFYFIKYLPFKFDKIANFLMRTMKKAIS